MRTKLFNALKVSTLALLISFGLSFVYAWTAPTANPPAGNVSAPINTSGTAQTKAGDFNIGNLISFVSSTGSTTVASLNAGSGDIDTIGNISGWDVVTNSLTSNNVLSRGVIQVGNDVTYICSTTKSGLIRYTGIDFEGCVNGVWKTLTTTAAPAQSPLLVNGQHTEAQCVAGGGTVIDPGTSNNYCKFVGGANPLGWTQYQSWSATAVKTCATPYSPVCGIHSCTTSSHSWGDVAQEFCVYDPHRVLNTRCLTSTPVSCLATISYIGMY